MREFGSVLVVFGIGVLCAGIYLTNHAYQTDVTISLDPFTVDGGYEDIPEDDLDRKLQWLKQRKRSLQGKNPKPRYVNTYLMDKRRTELMIGCSIVIVGVMFIFSGILLKGQRNENTRY